MSLVSRIITGAAVVALVGTLISGAATSASAGVSPEAKKVQAPIAEMAAPAPAAKKALIVARAYEHDGYGGADLYQFTRINPCTTTGQVYSLGPNKSPFTAGMRISSLYFPTTYGTKCNYITLYSWANNVTYYTCKVGDGIRWFGYPFNDYVRSVKLSYNPNCV